MRPSWKSPAWGVAAITSIRGDEMKTLLLTVLLVLTASWAWADPFLVCAPQSDADEYIVTFDLVDDPPTPYNEFTFPDGTTWVVLKDLAGIPEGNHQVDVKAVNMWGESASVPFAFIKSLPGSAPNIGLHR